MASTIQFSVGIDMAKDKFDACLVMKDSTQLFTVKSSRASLPNNLNGFTELCKWVSKNTVKSKETVFCMEATGVYYESLAWYLFQNHFSVIVVLPNKAKYYLKSLGFKSKNDKIDAKGLAYMAIQQKLNLWKPFSDTIYQLRHLTRLYQQLQESKTIFRNQLHAYDSGHVKSDVVQSTLQGLISDLDTKIRDVNEAIELALKGDPGLWSKVQKINTVKGLGLLSIATIIAETNGFELFNSLAQVVSYAGYDVTENQSGNRTGKQRISKKGNNRIRRVLFLPAFSVVKYKQKPFSDLYNRVYDRSRLKMKAYVAVQRKLLILIYTLWKRNEEYNPGKYLPKTDFLIASR